MRSVLLAASLALASLSLVGCGGSPAPTPPDSRATSEAATVAAVADAQAAPVAATEPATRGHHAGDWAFRQIDALDLTEEQKTAIEGVKSELHARVAPLHVAMSAVGERLADGLAAGKIDDAALESDRKTLETRMADARVALTDAANRVHGILDADQRTELVLTLRASREERRAPRDDKGESRHGFGRVADELGLSAEQEKSLRDGARSLFETAFPSRKERREKMEATMRAAEDAFMTEEFDAKAYDFGPGPEGFVRGATSIGAQVSSLAAKVLTDEQRQIVAAKIRGAISQHQR